jgi:hypothetical protein
MGQPHEKRRGRTVKRQGKKKAWVNILNGKEPKKVITSRERKVQTDKTNTVPRNV